MLDKKYKCILGAGSSSDSSLQGEVKQEPPNNASDKSHIECVVSRYINLASHPKKKVGILKSLRNLDRIRLKAVFLGRLNRSKSQAL